MRFRRPRSAVCGASYSNSRTAGALYCPRVDARCSRMCGAAADMFGTSMAWVEGSLRCGERARSRRRRSRNCETSSREWRLRGSKQTLWLHGIVKMKVYNALTLDRKEGPRRWMMMSLPAGPTFSPSRAAIADRGPASRCRPYVAYSPAYAHETYTWKNFRSIRTAWSDRKELSTCLRLQYGGVTVTT